MDAGVKVGEITVKSVGNGFQIHIGYEVSNPDVVEDNGRYLGVDPGLDNLITIVSNVEGLRPLVVGGQAVKSTNQYFNKKIIRLEIKICRKTAFCTNKLTYF